MKFIELKTIGADLEKLKPFNEKLDRALKALNGEALLDAAQRSKFTADITDANEKISAELKAHGMNLDYKKTLINLLGERPAQGMKVSTMRRHQKMLDQLEKVDDLLILDDADHTILIELIGETTWSENSKTIVEFCDDIENASSADPRTVLEAAE